MRCLPFTCALVSCSPPLVRVEAGLPLDVRWVATLVSDSFGRLEASSPLIAADSPVVEIEVDGTSELDGSFIDVLGYSEPDFAEVEIPPPDVLAASPILPTSTGARRLPRPSYFASGRITGASASLAKSSTYAVTSGWMRGCPTACEVVPIGEATRIELGTAGTGRIVIPMDERSERLLLITNRNELVEISNGRVSPLFANTASAAEITGGVRAGDRYFVADLLGSLFELELGRGLTRLGALRGGRPKLAGGIGPDGPEVFATSDAGTLERWVGSELLAVHSERLPDGLTRVSSSLIWLAPGEVIAIFKETSAVVHLVEGEVFVDDSVFEPRAIGLVDGLGPVIATAGGGQTGDSLFHLVGSSWQPLGGESGFPPFGVWSAGRGFFFGGLRGVLSYHDFALGVCPAQSLAEADVHEVVPTLDRLIVVMTVRDQDLRRPSILEFPLRDTRLETLGCGAQR
ncbi:MAG: hypothetical protein HY791_21750 [Deltaproteobacteria bacterium]|nr:hypothetical protein [Deltaproteobacteria bacterium]